MFMRASWVFMGRRVRLRGMSNALKGLVVAVALLGSARAATAVTTTNANMRRLAHPNAVVVKVVPRNTLLTVACGGQWCRTSYQGRGGYIYRPLLRQVTRSVPLSGVFYTSCMQVRARGLRPIPLGQPGYRVSLDSNRNNLACDQGDR